MLGPRAAVGTRLTSTQLMRLMPPVHMMSGMGDRRVETIEDVTFGIEFRQDTSRGQEPPVFGTYTLDEDGDAAAVKLVDDLGKGIGARGVDKGQPPQPKNDDLDSLDLSKLFEEARSRAEEECSV